MFCASVSLCVWEDEKSPPGALNQVFTLDRGNVVVCLWKSRAGTQHPSRDGTSWFGAQGSVQLCLSPLPSRAQG